MITRIRIGPQYMLSILVTVHIRGYFYDLHSYEQGGSGEGQCSSKISMNKVARVKVNVPVRSVYEQGGLGECCGPILCGHT